eukprot:UN20476
MQMHHTTLPMVLSLTHSLTRVGGFSLRSLAVGAPAGAP